MSKIETTLEDTEVNPEMSLAEASGIGSLTLSDAANMVTLNLNRER